MLLSLNNNNIKLYDSIITFGSSYSGEVRLSKGDKIALKRFHLKFSNTDRSIFQDSLGLKQFKLCITHQLDDRSIVGYSEQKLFHTFTYAYEDDSYTYEANEDELIFQEGNFDQTSIDRLQIYGIDNKLPKYIPMASKLQKYIPMAFKLQKYIPIAFKPDTIFELEWVIKKAEA